MTMKNLLVVSAFLILMSACATQPYTYESTGFQPVRDRAETQTEGEVSISASVPGEHETEAIFGVPLYNRAIQPVWLEIVNNSPERVRFAPTSLDRDYYPPLEVAYMFRKGFSKEARAKMDRYFHANAMPRQIPAGATRSGYVFTHASPGTKSFNIDLFGGDSDYSFAFFINTPGFVPDHATIDFDSLYAQSEVTDHDLSDIRMTLKSLPLMTTNQSGQQSGLPVGIAIVGNGSDVLKALLRAGWYESPRIRDEAQLERAQYLFGRIPDAVFRIQRNSDSDRNELYLWMAPMRFEGKAIWLAQISHFIGQRTRLEQAILGSRIDPDIDDGRNFFVQNMWYSQNLEQSGWLATDQVISIENARQDFNGVEYFTDGYLLVNWLSGTPVSLTDTRTLDWGRPSGEQ